MPAVAEPQVTLTVIPVEGGVTVIVPVKPCSTIAERGPICGVPDGVPVSCTITFGETGPGEM